MLVDLPKAQDIEAGDGTTTVVVTAGSLSKAAERPLGKGLHLTLVAEPFLRASEAAQEVLIGMSYPVDRQDEAALVNLASTSLNSKVIAQYSRLLAPMAVKAVKAVVDPFRPHNADLKSIKIINSWEEPWRIRHLWKRQFTARR